MAALAKPIEENTSGRMTNVARLDADTAWAAFMRRDRAWDGRVVGAVKTTGIYCKPSCPAKRPKREHVAFYATGEEARSAGFRACLRCKPDEVGRDREAVAAAVKLIDRATRRTISSASSSATSACLQPNMHGGFETGGRRMRSSRTIA